VAEKARKIRMKKAKMSQRMKLKVGKKREIEDQNREEKDQEQ